MDSEPILQITKAKDGQIVIKYNTVDEIDPVEEIEFIQHIIQLKEKISEDSDIAKQFGELLLNEIEFRLAKMLIWYVEKLDQPSKG
jgi:hypothetical protein